MKLALLINLFLLMSCTSTRYQSLGLINTFAGLKSTHTIHKKLAGHNEFYMWGILPHQKIVNIDKLAVQSGMSEFSVSKIEEYQTLKQFAFSVMTFGMYIPNSYKIVGYGIKSGI